MNIGDTVYAWKFYMWLCLLHEEGIYMSLCLYDTLLYMKEESICCVMIKF